MSISLLNYAELLKPQEERAALSIVEEVDYIGPGIHRISNEKYHASEGISRSGITELMISPLNYWDKYINPDKPEKKASKAMTLGSAVHTLLLEPHLFDSEFLVTKHISYATIAGKQYKQEIQSILNGRTEITEEDLEIAHKMVDSVKRRERLTNLIDGALIERSIYWYDEETGLLCKARPDVWNDEINILCDVKTSSFPSPAEFAYSFLSGGYHIQAAMQIDSVYKNTGKLIEDFRFLVIPTVRPFSPYLFTPPPAIIERGRREYKDALKIAKICYDRNQWDMERHMTIPLDFSDHQLSKNSLHQLKELYHYVRIST